MNALGGKLAKNFAHQNKYLWCSTAAKLSIELNKVKIKSFEVIATAKISTIISQATTAKTQGCSSGRAIPDDTCA